MDIRTASFTKDYQFDLVSQDNGLFCLVAEFDNGVKFEVLLYVNDGEVYIAEYAYDTISDETILGYIEKPARIKEIAESYNVTPEKSLSVDKQDIAYPVLSKDPNFTARCDIDLWREKAHEIVTDDTLADSVKAIMLHDWMTQTLAYDTYKTRVCKQWRAGYYNDFTGT